MKKQIIILLVIALVIGCASQTTRTGENTSLSDVLAERNMSFSDVAGKEWKLVEVYIDNRDIRFSRDSQPEVFRDIFTLNFDGQMVSGTGAPNRYSAPYTLDENHSISIRPMISTQMAALFEPENLREFDFFAYLQGAYSWGFINNNLVINSRTQDGREIRLMFAL